MLRAKTACTFSTPEPPKVVRTPSAFNILTWKRASRHNGVHFFDYLKCQKWSAPLVFCTFWLANVLRATTACTFSTSQLPKVVREWCALYILPWKCASRHNGVQFFISPLASWLRTRRFSEPTFRPSGAPNHWKNTVFRDFPTFSRISIFFLLTLSLLLFSFLIFLFSLPLPYSAFHLSILSEVWLLNFLRSYIKCIYLMVTKFLSGEWPLSSRQLFEWWCTECIGIELGPPCHCVDSKRFSASKLEALTELGQIHLLRSPLFEELRIWHGTIANRHADLCRFFWWAVTTVLFPLGCASLNIFTCWMVWTSKGIPGTWSFFFPSG